MPCACQMATVTSFRRATAAAAAFLLLSAVAPGVARAFDWNTTDACLTEASATRCPLWFSSYQGNDKVCNYVTDDGTNLASAVATGRFRNRVYVSGLAQGT